MSAFPMRSHRFRWEYTNDVSFRRGFFFGSANLLFGLEPVVELRVWLIASLDIEFVGSSPDLFFARRRRELGFLCRCGCGHGITSGDTVSQMMSDRKGGVMKQVTDLSCVGTANSIFLERKSKLGT